MKLEGLLNELKVAVSGEDCPRDKILSTMDKLLAWLSEPANNTDENCRKVDYYVAQEILNLNAKETIPEDIWEILFDMGGALHDTHTNPEIAVNFESTPPQLLNRVRRLRYDTKSA